MGGRAGPPTELGGSGQKYEETNEFRCETRARQCEVLVAGNVGISKDGYDGSNSACFSVLATVLVAGNVEVPERWP